MMAVTKILSFRVTADGFITVPLARTSRTAPWFGCRLRAERWKKLPLNVISPFTFSPDDKQIAFINGDTRRLHLVNADGSGERVFWQSTTRDKAGLNRGVQICPGHPSTIWLRFAVADTERTANHISNCC